MRAPSYKSRWSLTVILLAVNIAVFLLESILNLSHLGDAFVNYCALSLEGLEHGYIWQLLTYQFMHAGIWHLFFNCWAIYVFGREVEAALSPKQFLTLYFASGIIGGLVQMLGALVWPGHFGGGVVGASAAAFGLVAAFAVLYPERPLMLLLFFIIPLNMRAKYLLLGCALLSLYGVIFPFGNIAHAAHLGGMLTGIVFIRHGLNWNFNWPWAGRFNPSRPRELVKVHAGKSTFWSHPKTTVEQELSPDEFLSREVDPILDKISAHGIHSLTERERKILEAARKKMAK